MTNTEDNARAFSTFRALNGDANSGERDQLFRNMAQLFAHVSDRCDDDQVAQYDEVLCQLADLVEESARAEVAATLAPLERAPGTVVVKLANDTIQVAAPLLEFSQVLSDDDLIEIVSKRSEEHRVFIAGREAVDARVGDAIVVHGGTKSVHRLIRNETAEFGDDTVRELSRRAQNDPELKRQLVARQNVNAGIVTGPEAAGGKLLRSLATESEDGSLVPMGKVNAVIHNRRLNRTGFNAQEWKVAWNQVKALSDRRQLNERALARFARFSYGHHVAAALTSMMFVPPEVFVKWLATQDYVALTVAAKAVGLSTELFIDVVAVLPWRDQCENADLQNASVRYESLSGEEATGIFQLWRAHAFRRRPDQQPQAGAA